MSNEQLYLAIGVPLVMGLINTALYVGLLVALSARMTALDTRFDLLTAKVAELDNRLARVEERLAR